jgi:hypothetical protein
VLFMGVKIKLSGQEEVWRSGRTAPPFLTSAQDGGEGSAPSTVPTAKVAGWDTLYSAR